MSDNEELDRSMLITLASTARDEIFEVVRARNSDRADFDRRLAESTKSLEAEGESRNNDRLSFDNQVAALSQQHSAAVDRREKMLRALEARVRERDDELEAQRRAYRKVRKALEEAHASTSWQVTKPLRAVSQFVTKRRL